MSVTHLTSVVERAVPLTSAEDTDGAQLRLKVFWPTTNLWNDAHMADYHKEASSIVQHLIRQQYWNQEGAVDTHRFTCEDFAIRVLCEYASSRGLPVKLSTGVRTYRNMEVYSPAQHDTYASHMYGFTEMVMLTYGAPDMQRPQNTISLSSPVELRPGDILAQSKDRPGNLAHHIQLATRVSPERIDIRQGNTGGAFYRPISTIRRWLGENLADPQNTAYAGLPIESGQYVRAAKGWDYRNLTTGSKAKDFLRIFELYRWNFREFNRP
ncbi:hypothetical protein [Halomonas binhaiensis]|uniref:Uncharacterized protein n=1 Tax=Halomonas binhaiensis TaxID=2562282 RepID=A0A5C1NLR1_9GAMM|nr:hypothetical protein [Halomonas binhaiensis]QEM83770.1 hypothetical protein E4T21_21000 [Halomonas binhaiensis]